MGEITSPPRETGFVSPVTGLAPTALTDVAPADSPEALPSILLRGIRLHRLTEDQTAQFICHQIRSDKGGWAITVNLDHLRRLSHDRALRDLYHQAQVLVADGMPLIWASRMQGTALPERVAGSSLISTLSGAAARENRSIYLLGGAPGTANAAAEVLAQRYPGLRIAGTDCPPPGFENDPQRMAELIARLSKADPDIVYVALGSPKQELLIGRIREQLPRAWWLGIGISFSFLSGHVKRAPVWMQRIGLEWLHRLCQEPKRLAKRYLVDGLPFAAWMLATALARRVFFGPAAATAPAARVNAPEPAGALATDKR